MSSNSNKIKIAFIIDNIDYNMGGTERQLLLFLDHLDCEKFIPYLCTFRKSYWREEQVNKWKSYFFPFNSFFSPISYFHLWKFSLYLKREGIQIIHTHFRDGNIVGILAAKLAGVPIIISSRRNQGYWLNRKELMIVKILNRYVHGFITNSENVKSFVEAVEGVPANRIKVIYNGIDYTMFQEKTSDLRIKYRKQLGLPLDAPVVTMVSNLRPIKSIDFFIEAISLPEQRLENVHYIIVGEGTDREFLQQLAAERGIAERVHFLGKRNDIHKLLSISDLGVLSSRSEGLSNAIIEYMAAGLPVVCTDVGGNSELVIHGENGYLVPFGDAAEFASAIQCILSDPELAERMGRASIRRIMSDFSLDTMVNKTQKYYQELFHQFI